jgi:fibronectin-binding autotransporter adhesin
LAGGLAAGFDTGLSVPNATRTDTTVNFPTITTTGLPGGVVGPNLGITWAGVLRITTGGTYNFQVGSDDGSMMFVDGVPVVVNDNPQGVTYRGGSLTLSPGFHSVVIRYAQGGVPGGVIANYTGPDTGNVSALLGSVANTLSSNGTRVVGSATIDNNIFVPAAKIGTISAVGGNITSTGAINLGAGATLNITGETNSEVVTQTGAIFLNGRGVINTGGVGQSLQFQSAGADLTVSGDVLENVVGSSLLKTGGRTLTLTGAYGWTGSTTLAGGFLALNKPLPGALTIINNNFNNANSTGVIGSGTFVVPSTVNIYGASAGNNDFSGAVDLGGTAKTFNVWGQGTNRITGTLANGELVKTGLGTLTLNTANAAYDGQITVNRGRVQVTNVSGLGATSGATVVNSGGFLDVANISIAEPLTLNGKGQPIPVTAGSPGATFTGALQGSGGFNAAVTGPITLASDSAIGVPAGSLLTISNVISGSSSLTKTQGNGTIIATNATTGGGGILKLTGVNTFTGDTIIEGGSLWLGAPGGPGNYALQSARVQIGNNRDGADLTLLGNEQMIPGVILDFAQKAGIAGKFQLNGYTQTVGGFLNSEKGNSFIQGYEVANTGGPGGTLIVNNAAATTYAAGFRDLNGVLSLTKQGAGTLTLSGNGLSGTGAIAYTGNTNVSAGKLILNDVTAFNSPITLSGSGSLEFNMGFGRSLVYQKSLIDGGLGFTKTGLGTLALNTASTVTGTINVNQGTLNISNAAGNVNPIPGAPINVAGGAQLQFFGVTGVTTSFNNNITLNGLTPGGALAGAVVGGTPTNTFTGTLTLNATSNVSTGWADKVMNLTGKITGAGGLVIDKLHFTQQPPIVNVTNTTNDYAGPTIINSGTVTFTAGALPGGNLAFGGTFGNGGNFGVGQYVLNATAGSSFTRAIGTGVGQVQFTGDGGGFAAIGAPATVNFGGAGAVVDWQGTGTTGMDANASLVMNMGTGANNAITVVNNFNLNSGVRRMVTQTNTVTYSGSFSGSSALVIEGPGTNVFSGATGNTYTGLTNVFGGTLTLNKTSGVAIAGDIHVSSNVGNNRRIIYLGNNEQIADTAFVTFLGSSGNNGDLRLMDFDETVAGILDRSGGGVIQVQEAENPAVSGAAGSVLTISGSADSFYNGFIRDRNTGIEATKRLSLTKNGSGTLTISAGQQSAGGNQTYSGATTINGGAVVFSNIGTLNSPITVNTGASVGFNANLSQALTEGQVISGSGDLFKTGLGLYNLSAVNAYSGTTTVNGGTLQISNGQTAAHTGGYTVNANGVLLIGNGTTAGALTNNNAITLNAGATVAFSRNNAYNYSGVISGAGNVQSRAGGTATILSGANTYSGSTTLLQNTTLTLAGSGVSAGGLNINSGSTLTLDFNLAGANGGGIVAATAPVNLNGGTLVISGGTLVSSQVLGPVTLGTALPGGMAGGVLGGLNPSQPGLGASNITLNSGAGGLNIEFGPITHVTGGTANITLPASGVVTTTGAAIGGIANGFMTTSGGTTWLAQDGDGVLTPLAAYGVNTFGAGVNTDVTGSGAGSSTNSLRFNTAAATTLTLAGTTTIDSGGILVTSAVGANASTISGGTLRGSSTAGLTLIQNNTGAGLFINSAIEDNGGATGLTKAGTGVVTLAGTNTHTGPTYVSQGTLVLTGSLGNSLTNVAQGATLQIGDGVTNGVIPTNFGVSAGTVTVANATAQTMTAFNAGLSYNTTANALANPTSYQTSVFTKTGAGTLTINKVLLSSQFHPRNGTVQVNSGGNVVNSGWMSVGQLGGDSGTLNLTGNARVAVGGDFNVTDAASGRGIVTLTDVASATGGNFFVGKGNNTVGAVYQSGLSNLSITGGGERRIGGVAASDTAAYGYQLLSSGTFTSSNSTQVGAYGLGVYSQVGGTSSFSEWPSIARFSTGKGVINVQGGVFNQATATTRRLIVGEEGAGTLNVGVTTPTTMYAAGQLLLQGGLSMGSGTTASGTTNLWYGGLINAATVGDHNANTANGTSTLNFHGGVLQARAATTTFVGGGVVANFNGNLTNAFVWPEGAVVDTNTFAVTIPQPLVAPTGSGVTNIPLLTGGSGYVGEPIVELTGGGGSGATARAIVVGGVVTGIQITNPGVNYTSAPTVNILGGGAATAATVGAPTVAANATTGGLTKIGTGVLTLTGTSTYGGATTITGGSINVPFSAVNQTNLLPTTTLDINGGGFAATGFAAGTNAQSFSATNITGVGSISSTIGTGGTMAVSLGTLSRSAGGAVDFSGTGTIDTLTANAGGTILGGWATHGGGANWAVSAGTGAVAGNITALGAYTANTWAAGNNTDITAATAAANLTTNSVRFSGAAPFTVTITGTSTISTGGVLITPTANTAATIFTGGTLATGTNQDLVVHHHGQAAGVATIASIIAANGTGGLVKAGTGILTISGTNTYAGPTNIGAGTLRLGVATAIPNGSVVTVGSGATLDLNNFAETIGGLSGWGTVTTGVAGTPTLTVAQSVDTTFNGVINNGTGTGVALTKSGTGTLTLNNIAAGTFTGATTISQGAIKIASPNALANNTVVNVNAANGLLFDTTIPTISGLAGNQNFSLQTTGSSPVPNAPVQLFVGNNNAAGTYSGALGGSGTLVKIGTGIQTLSGANVNTGGIVVNGGYLVLSGNNSAAGGSAFVNSGGILQLNAANSLWGASGRNLVISSGGVVTAVAPTALVTSPNFGSLATLLNRIDNGSTGVLALQNDTSVQAVTENLDFSSVGPISLGSVLNAPGNASGFGNAPVLYTGVITPHQNTFRIGGGTGRLLLPNSATLAGANSLNLYGGGSTTGLVFLNGRYGFTGGTIVNGGVTYISSLANGGTASSLGASSSAASNLILNGGTLSYIGTATSTDRLFTLSTGPTVLDASGSGPVNFTNTGAVEFLNSGNRTFTLQGTNTGLNTLAASIGDSVNIAGTNGTIANGITSVTKSGNGTWVLSGNNTFSGGVTISNGVLQFNSAASIGGHATWGPATVLVSAGGAVALGGSLTTGIQATLNRISPLSTGTIALTASTSENINFDGGSAGAQMSQAYLGAYGNVTYTGTLTPFGSIYRLGGGGGVLTMPNGGLNGPRQVLIGGGGPGAGFANNPNLQGNVVLGGTSDYSGGTTLLPGGILSATSVTALGSGPLKFEGGVYRAVDSTDITLASDGVSAREIRVGVGQTAHTANIDVVGGVTTTFSKTFGIPVTLGSNQGQAAMTKFGAGTLILANGLNLGTSNGTNNVATNAGTLIIERGTLSILANPTNYVGNIQVGSAGGGVGTLRLGADNVFANTIAQYGAATVIDLNNGSKIDLNGFSDTIRNIRGFGSIVNTGAGSPTLTTGTVAGENMIWGGNLVGNFVLKRVGNIPYSYGTGGGTNNLNGIELFNNYNPNFTGKFVADGGGIRLRADGTAGSQTEPLVVDKITLNNAGILFNTANPVVLGANRGIVVGNGGGTIWNLGSAPFVINGPISGPGMLTIADDSGTVMLGSDNNSWTGGTTINSGTSGRGMLSIGSGGATGSLPAGDVFFNSAAGAARLYLFKSSALNLANTLNGPGLVLQIGAGTTTLSGMNNTGQTTFIGGGKLRADFSGGNQPIGAGTAVQVGAGTFEYVAPAGDNLASFGQIVNASFGMPYQFTAGSTGDAAIQSTYGGTGVQKLLFTGFNARGAGSTLSFVTSGGVNGQTNSIGLSGAFTPNQAFGAAYYFGGSEFAAYDQGGFFRAIQATDTNAAADNAIVAGRYLRLTAAQTGQAALRGSTLWVDPPASA